jgi:ribonuclease HI
MGDELSEYIVDFEKRSAIKSQILADFVAEWMESGSSTEGIVLEASWLIYCDGAWGSTGARAAAILVSPSGIKLRYAMRLQFHREAEKCTNNIAEYKAILLGLRKLRAIGVQTCTLCTDSKVVAGQIKKGCIVRELTHERYLVRVGRMECYFKGFTIEYIERTKNAKANELMKVMALNTPLPADIFFQVIFDTSIKTVEAEPRMINLIEGKDWRVPTMVYLHDYYELDSAAEHIRMQQRTRAYQIIGNDLYKTSVSGPPPSLH